MERVRGTSAGDMEDEIVGGLGVSIGQWEWIEEAKLEKGGESWYGRRGWVGRLAA